MIVSKRIKIYAYKTNDMEGIQDRKNTTEQTHCRSVLTYPFLHSLGVVVYVALVALLMNNANNLFGTEDNIFTIIIVLLLFTISAAIVGSLIFAKPIMLIMQGQKKEGVEFALSTIGLLFLEFILILVIIAISSTL